MAVSEDVAGRARGGLLRDADFRFLWVADALSQFGTRVSYVALPLLAVYELHASTLQVSLLTVAETAAFLVLALPVGAWCDRMRNRPVLLVADVGRAFALGSLPVAAVCGVLTLWHVYLAVLVTGVLTVFFDVAHQSYLPRLIGREHVVEGNAKLQGNMSVAEVAGPTTAGYLIQWLTAPAAVLVDAVSYLCSAESLRRIRATEPPPPRVEKPALFREIDQGLRLVFAHSILRAIALNGASVVFFQSAGIAITMVFLARDIGLSAGAIGLLSSIGPIAAVAAAFTTRAIATRVGQARAMLFASILLGLGMLVTPLTDRGWHLTYFVIGGLVSGFCIVSLNVIQVSFRQTLCPDHLLGRMNATMRFMLRATAPFGALFGGVLGTALGLRAALWFAGAGVLLSVVWLLCSPLRRIRDLPTGHVTSVPTTRAP